MTTTLQQREKETILKKLGLPVELHTLQPSRNKSLQAVVYRNIRRKEVDSLFDRKNALLSLTKDHPNDFPKNATIWGQISALDYEARQLWRAIVEESNNM